MYTKPKKEIKPIERSDLIYFTKRLRNFIEFYEKYILVKDAYTSERLMKLKQYLEVLSLERYDMLINDTSIIHDDITVPLPPQPVVDEEYIQSILRDENLPF
jgi:hypothetical protein